MFKKLNRIVLIVSNNKMEFPEDVLSLIREYALPRMQFIHEYNEIVRLLGEELYPVKKKLEGPNAAIVLDQFAYYADAVVADKAAIEAHDAYDDAPSPDTMEMHWDKIIQLRRACTISRRLRKRTWRILMDLLEE